MELNNIWNNWSDADSFSGVFTVSGEQGLIFEKCCGLRNRSENLPNDNDTAIGWRRFVSKATRSGWL